LVGCDVQFVPLRQSDAGTERSTSQIALNPPFRHRISRIEFDDHLPQNARSIHRTNLAL
jgi:hypothetical protein